MCFSMSSRTGLPFAWIVSSIMFHCPFILSSSFSVTVFVISGYSASPHARHIDWSQSIIMLGKVSVASYSFAHCILLSFALPTSLNVASCIRVSFLRCLYVVPNRVVLSGTSTNSVRGDESVGVAWRPAVLSNGHAIIMSFSLRRSTLHAS